MIVIAKFLNYAYIIIVNFKNGNIQINHHNFSHCYTTQFFLLFVSICLNWLLSLPPKDSKGSCMRPPPGAAWKTKGPVEAVGNAAWREVGAVFEANCEKEQMTTELRRPTILIDLE